MTTSNDHRTSFVDGNHCMTFKGNWQIRSRHGFSHCYIFSGSKDSKIIIIIVATSYPQSIVIEDNASCTSSPNSHVGYKCCFFRCQAVALINMIPINIKTSTDDDSVSNKATSGSMNTDWKFLPVFTQVASFDSQIYYFWSTLYTIWIWSSCDQNLGDCKSKRGKIAKF